MLGIEGGARVVSTTSTVLSYVGYTSAGIVSSPHTFTSHAIGAASANRFVVVCSSVSNVSPPTACTVAGQAMTLVKSVASPSTRSTAVFVTNAAVTTGTTADIVCTMGGTRDLEISVYTLELANTPTSPDYSATDTQTGTDTMSVNVNVDDGGSMLAVCIYDTETVTVSWTGVTKDVDNASSNYQSSYAHDNFPSGEVGRTISTASVNSYGGMLVCSWSP